MLALLSVIDRRAAKDGEGVDVGKEKERCLFTGLQNLKHSHCFISLSPFVHANIGNSTATRLQPLVRLLIIVFLNVKYYLACCCRACFDTDLLALPNCSLLRTKEMFKLLKVILSVDVSGFYSIGYSASTCDSVQL